MCQPVILGFSRRIGVGASTSGCGLNHLFGIGDWGAVTMTKECKAAPPFTLTRSAGEAAFRGTSRGRCGVPRLIASKGISWVLLKWGSSNSRMRGPSARDFRRHNSGVQWCLLRASHPWYLGSARRNGVGLRSRRNPTRDIRVEGVPMAHLAPGRQRDWGPSCFSRHWTPEPCLKKSRGEAASV